MKISWIGQSGYILESSEKRMVIDPYLSNSLLKKGFTRMISNPIKIAEINPDYILCSHEHGDHFDQETIKKIINLFPEAKLIGPESVIEHSMKMNISKSCLIPFNLGDILDLGTFHLTATLALHSDPHGIGAIIEADGYCIYFSGDTVYKPYLSKHISNYTKNIDLMLVIINGKLFNMNYIDAVKFSEELSPEIVVPMHFGMFYENTENPENFMRLCKTRNIRCSEMVIGKTYTIDELKSQ